MPACTPATASSGPAAALTPATSEEGVVATVSAAEAASSAPAPAPAISGAAADCVVPLSVGWLAAWTPATATDGLLGLAAATPDEPDGAVLAVIDEPVEVLTPPDGPLAPPAATGGALGETT